jgi:hypothetical protein
MGLIQAFLVGRIVILLALAGILLHLTLGRSPSRRTRALIFVVLGAALISYPNFGFLHPYNFRPIHYWDAYHYFMGAKYLPELGYFKLYEATYVAGRELGVFAEVTHIRDLPTHLGRWVTSIDAPAIRARFAPERWEAFKRDLAFLEPRVPYWSAFFLDHGYNDPPPRALLLHLLVRSVPANRVTFGLLTSIDYVLMAIAFGVVRWTFGTIPASLTFAFLALSFFGRFDFIGGSILRWDWMAALLIGVGVFARGHGQLAGLLFAYATLARIFPVLFFVPLVIKWLQERRAGAPVRTLTYCLAWGIGAVIAVTLGLGVMGTRLPVIFEYIPRMELHSASSSTNRVGLGPLLISSSALWIVNPDGSTSLDEASLPAARPAPYTLPLISAIYLLAALPLILRARPLQSLMYAIPLIYCALSLASYYYAFLSLLVLLPWEEGWTDSLRLVQGAFLILITAISYTFELGSDGFLSLFYKVSIQMGLFFAVWLAFEYARLRAPAGNAKVWASPLR